MEEPVAPLREGTEATIRLTSLSGIANRYVALQPGAGATRRSSPDGATLTTDATTSVVDLDQIFNTLDERTRGGLRNVIQRLRRRSTPGAGAEATRRRSTSTRCSRPRAGSSAS